MDTILYNGVIHTMAGRTVSALAIQKGRVALAGEDASALALATPETRRIDLEGRCVLPGFTDSHMHMLLTGLGFRRLDLRGVSSVEELVERGRAYVARQSLAPGEWVIGYGFDHNRFPVPVLPDGAAAEAISRDIPVVLDRVCGHVGAANAKALALAGFDEATVIPGGALDKDPSGRLTGVLREAALDRIKSFAPRLDQSLTEALLEAGASPPRGSPPSTATTWGPRAPTGTPSGRRWTPWPPGTPCRCASGRSGRPPALPSSGRCWTGGSRAATEAAG